MARAFLRASVFYQLFYYIPVHQRLTAEKVNLKIGAASGIFNKEIQSSFSHLKAHKRSVSMVFALAGETVRAVEITCVCHMQTQRFDNISASFFKSTGNFGEGVRRIKFALIL